MDFIISTFQLIILVLFFYTLRCEISKQCSDSALFVSIRLVIMCTLAIAFYMLFEPEYHNVDFLVVAFIPTIFGIAYSAFEAMSGTQLRCLVAEKV